MSSSIYRPNFGQATAMFHQAVDRHALDLAFAELVWHEHKDEDGSVFQLTPWVRMEFKGLVA